MRAQEGTPSFRTKVGESVAAIKRGLSVDALPSTLVILGSGFKGFEACLRAAKLVELKDLPHFPVPKVAGHGAALVVGSTGATQVVVLTGRVHLYEGHEASEVVYPIRALASLGVKRVLLTNAAGSVTPRLKPGDVVLVRDQINLTGKSCLMGPEAKELQPLFVDMGEAFDLAWRKGIRERLKTLTEGIYAGVLGPAYETPAETRMLATLGADVVGMSTVQEVIAARQLGLAVACLSFVTNMAGGLGAPLSHSEVLALVDRHQTTLHDLLLKSIAA